MDKRLSFYKATIDKWIKHRDANILVVAGGKNDYEVFRKLGFINVTISNLDERMEGDEFNPFKWSYQDAENLSFEENSFDFVVVHAALHHCFSPHRALLNMYRVAQKGVILLESRDSFVMKIVEYCGLAQTYEHAAVFYNDCKYGGVRNTNIPNFVYRWTEREIEKTINSYAPYAQHHFYFNYDYDLPRSAQHRKKESYKMIFVYSSCLFYSIFAKLFPRQQNLFSCFIEKPDLERKHFEWLKYNDGKITFNKEWAYNYYKKTNE